MSEKKKPGNWLDRVVMSMAPQWGLRRVRARAAAQALARHYDAAGAGRRTSGWKRFSSDPNAANGPALATLRELSRDLRRNNGWARRGIRVISTNTVGWGISAKPIGARQKRKGDALWYWDQWSRSPRCDFDGRLPFAGIQRLVMETVVESGECLVMRERGRPSDGGVIPLRVRVLEPDHLDTAKDGVLGDSGGPIVQGVEFDKRGQRVAYWIFKQHPGSAGRALLVSSTMVSERIAAEDVLHIYRVDRPGQVRGVPWLATAIAKLEDFHDYDDAVLMQQKIAACFAAFVQDADAERAPIGEEDPQDDQLETLEPGQISYLGPGKSITFAQPPATTDHANFSATTLRQIASGLDVTYEELTGDYSHVNFSSARMARLSHWSSVEEWRWNMLIPQLCDGVWAWAMEDAAIVEGWVQLPQADWSPPPMPMLDPDKEAAAYTKLVRSGVMTLQQVIRERGEDFVAHVAEIEEANKLLDEKGVWLDSDPRRTSAAGLTQERVGAASKQGGQGDGASDGADAANNGADGTSQSADA